MLLNGLGIDTGPRLLSQSPGTGRSGGRVRNGAACRCL